jgi:hypothetical protein
MGDDIKSKEAPVISTRTSIEVQQQIDEEGQLRGHTRSQALEQIIKLGLPRYLKKFRKKYERVENAAA